jgi:hypothetical protein
MLTAISNIFHLVMIDLPGQAWLAAKDSLAKWWYSHYH